MRRPPLRALVALVVASGAAAGCPLEDAAFLAPCSPAAACPGDYRCFEGQCVPPGFPFPPADDVDAGVVDAGPEDAGVVDGGTDAGPAPLDTCETAGAGVAGVAALGSLDDARNDYQGACSAVAGDDEVYRYTLPVASGLRASVNGADVVVLLLGSTCDDAAPLACQDVDRDGPLEAPLLPAGNYFVVVDGAGPGADLYELTVDLTPGGFCLGDDIDRAGSGNQSVASAHALGAGDVDAAAPGDGDALTLCPAQVDHFLVGHLGGSLSITVDDGGAGVVGGTVFAATVSGGTVTEGAELGALPFTPKQQARGSYLVKLADPPGAPAVPAVGEPYALSVAHGCDADAFDDVDAAADDDALARVRLVIDADAAGVARTVCLDDVDTVRLVNVIDGDIGVTLDGAGGGALAVGQVTLEQIVDGAAVPFAGHGVVDDGAALVVDAVDAPAGDYLLTINVGAAGPAETLAYDVAVAFERPPNDTCDGAVVLAASDDPVPVAGTTLRARDDVNGLCNGDEFANGAGVDGAGEVLYRFTLASTVDTEIDVQSAPPGSFAHSVNVFRLPSVGAACPAQVNDLPVLRAGGFPVCNAGVTERQLRLPDLAPGEYLVSVDGVFTLTTQSSTSGSFTIAARTFPGAGFPPPAACVSPPTQPLPAPGGLVSFNVQNVSGANVLERGRPYGGCPGLSSSTGLPLLGDANETAFRIAPSTDLELVIQVGDDINPVVVVQEGRCGWGEQLTCAWTDTGNGLSLAASVRAGREYFVIVDGIEPSEVAAGIPVAISASAP